MGNFSGPLVVEITEREIAGRTLAVTRGMFRYQGDVGEQSVDVLVPDAFETDFASVPRLFWWLVPPLGRYAKATVIHDYLYVTGELSRALADDVLYQAMLDLRVKAWLAWIIYAAVRLWGFFYWRRCVKLGSSGRLDRFGGLAPISIYAERGSNQ